LWVSSIWINVLLRLNHLIGLVKVGLTYCWSWIRKVKTYY